MKQGTLPQREREARKLPGVDELQCMTPPQLRALWTVVMGRHHRKPPPAQRSILLRELAWRIQSARLAGGDLDPETQRLLNAAIRAALAPRNAPRPAPRKDTVRISKQPAPPGTPARPSRPSHHTVSALAGGMRLVRLWRGVKHEVEVIEDAKRLRFRFRGREYQSLSPIARQITGTVWSGPRFFGLMTRARKRGAP